MSNVSNVREIIESDGRETVCEIAKAVGISLSRVHFILKLLFFKLRKFSAHHLLTNEHTS